MIKYATQDISKKDISEVVKTLKSDYITQGPKIEEFESNISKYCNVKHSISVSSATNALHLSYLTLGLSKGDYLWTSPVTFVSTVNAALFCGAKIEYVDIDPKTFNISVDSLEKQLVKAEKNKKLPKIIVPVHLGGVSCEMQRIYKLSKKYKFKIVEDASHALGGRYNNKVIGNCEFSDICVFSFHPVKIITTGEGGIVLTKNSTIAKKIKLLRSHGTLKNIKNSNFYKNEIWNYKQYYLGYHYRMTDINATLGISQLKRVDSFVKKRNFIAKKYNNAFKKLPIITQKINQNCLSSYHLYLFKIDKGKTKKTRNQLYKFLEENNIQPNFHYIPVYRHPFHNKKKYKKNMYEETENYFKNAITIPLHTKLTSKEQNYIISIINKFFDK